MSERDLYPVLSGQRLNKRFVYGFKRTYWPTWVVRPANLILCWLMGCNRTLMYIDADWNEDGTYNCSNCRRRYPVPESLRRQFEGEAAR